MYSTVPRLEAGPEQIHGGRVSHGKPEVSTRVGAVLPPFPLFSSSFSSLPLPRFPYYFFYESIDSFRCEGRVEVSE